jgi:DNA-binding SARP family transcriptional activator
MAASSKLCGPLIRFYLFGPPRVFVDSHEIPDRAWGRKRSKKIFFYLAMRSDVGFSCSDLMDAFWPKASFKRGYESLRSAIQAIRRTLRREAGITSQVVAMGEGRCRLDPGLKVWVDGWELDALLQRFNREKDQERQKRLVARAVALIRGAFCEGWKDPWVAKLERQLTADRLDIVRAFGKACLEHGRVVESIPHFEKALALDGLHEETCRNLMTAYTLLGRKKDVKGVFEELKARLYMELRVIPEVETKRLYYRLIRGPRPIPKEVVP